MNSYSARRASGKSPSKSALVKYAFEPFDAYMQRVIHNNSLVNLPISLDHAKTLITLPFHHRDPFDRLLIAQASPRRVTDGHTLFDKYPLRGFGRKTRSVVYLRWAVYDGRKYTEQDVT